MCVYCVPLWAQLHVEMINQTVTNVLLLHDSDDTIVMSTSRSFGSMYGWEPCIGWQYGQTLAVGAGVFTSAGSTNW